MKQILHLVSIKNTIVKSFYNWFQSGRSCAKARRAFAKKVLTWTKILSPNIQYFVAILRFVAIYALFGNLRAKKCLFFFGKKCTIANFCHPDWFELNISRLPTYMYIK